MEYIYASLLLFSAKQEINESNVKKVLQAVGVMPDEGRIKALVSSLEGVNIEETIKQAASAQVSAPAASTAKTEDKHEAKKEEKKDEQAAAQGLGALFG